MKSSTLLTKAIREFLETDLETLDVILADAVAQRRR
jgi:hypothetical protein